jgi:hypothetical protein
MTGAEAADLCRRIAPTTVVPIHYEALHRPLLARAPPPRRCGRKPPPTADRRRPCPAARSPPDGRRPKTSFSGVSSTRGTLVDG